MGAITGWGTGRRRRAGEGAVDPQSSAASVPRSVPRGGLGFLQEGLHDGYAFCLRDGSIDEVEEVQSAI